RREEIVEHEGLADRAVGANADGHVEVADFAAHAAAGYRDDFHLREVATEVHNRVDTAFFRHDDIGHHEVDVALGVDFQALVTVARFAHRIAHALEHRAEDFADLDFVVNYQDVRHGFLSPRDRWSGGRS